MNKKPWVEHRGPSAQDVYDAHLMRQAKAPVQSPDDVRAAYSDALDNIRTNYEHLLTCDPITHPVNVQATINALEAALWQVRKTVGVGR